MNLSKLLRTARSRPASRHFFLKIATSPKKKVPIPSPRENPGKTTQQDRRRRRQQYGQGGRVQEGTQGVAQTTRSA